MNKTLDQIMQELVAKHGAMQCSVAFFDACQITFGSSADRMNATLEQKDRIRIQNALRPIVED